MGAEPGLAEASSAFTLTGGCTCRSTLVKHKLPKYLFCLCIYFVPCYTLNKESNLCRQHRDALLFLSDRDPNFVQTLSAFGKSVDWAKSGKFTQQDIDEAKLSVFSAVDTPVAPADKGAKIVVVFFFSLFTRKGKTQASP